MYEQVEKPKVNTSSADRRKSRAVANSVSQKKSGGKQGFGFVDNRGMQKNNPISGKSIIAFNDRRGITHKSIQLKELTANSDNEKVVQRRLIFNTPTQDESNSTVKYVENTGKAKPVTQLASEYDGLLPRHETNQDSYVDGSNAKKNEFTYHHIIPENKLVKVAQEFVDIRKNIGQYSHDVGLRGEFIQSLSGLQGNAKEQWFETRLKDFQFFMHNEFFNDGLTFTNNNLKPVLTANKTTQSIIEAVLKIAISQTEDEQKIQFSQRRQVMASKVSQESHAIVDQLKTVNNTQLSTYQYPSLYWIDQYADIANVEKLKKEVRENIANARSKADLKNALEAVRSWSYEDYYQDKCKTLKVSHFIKSDDLSRALAVSSGQSELAKLVGKYALPHDNQNDFYLTSSVQWNPGNIHRGPSSSKRLDPSKQGFNKYLDDGGNEFEKAAVQILTGNHYRQLYKLNSDIDTFLENNHKDTQKLEQAKDLAIEMCAIQNHGLTQFDYKQWESIPGNPSKMRLKQNSVSNDQDHLQVINPPQQVNQVQNQQSSYTWMKAAAVPVLTFVGYHALKYGIAYFGEKK